MSTKRKYWKIGLTMLVVSLMLLGSVLSGLGETRIGPIREWNNDPTISQLEQWLISNNYQIDCDQLVKAKYDFGNPDNLENGRFIAAKFPINDINNEPNPFEANVEFSNAKDNNEFLSVSFSEANRKVYFFVVKYGLGADTYFYPEGTFEDGPITVPGNQAISHITFYYCDVELGELLITKQFEMGDTIGTVAYPASITVEVTGASYPEGEEFTIDIDPFTGYGEVLVENLIPDEYYVNELEFDGSDAWDSHIEGSPATVVAGATPTVKVNITNTFLPGCLEVNKTFIMGDTVNADAVDKDFSITITGPSYPAGDTKTGTGNETLTWCNLIPGPYTVEETVLNPDLWDIDISPATVRVPADDTGTADVENTFLPGCLEITKEWITGELYFDDEIPPSIKILIEGPSYDDVDQYPEGGLVVTLGAPWIYETCFVLIPGQYTVTELDVDSSNWAVTYDVGEGEVAEPTPITVDPDDKAEVTIRNYFLFGDDTFWAYGEDESLGGEEGETAKWNNGVEGNPSNAWGWTNFINKEGSYDWDLWAAAGQNKLENGYKVGTLTVIVEEDNDGFKAKVNYEVTTSFFLDEYHLWVGNTELPMVQRGRNTVPTAAPGQMTSPINEWIFDLCGDGFYVAAHGVVRVGHDPMHLME